MKISTFLIFFLLFYGCIYQNSTSESSKNEILGEETNQDIVFKSINDIHVPKGYKKSVYTEGVFAFYLNHLPLKKDKTVYLFNGEKKKNQKAQYAILDISVGEQDLQQCADGVMRLRAEYLFLNKLYDKIHFNTTEGSLMRYTDWANGNHNLLNPHSISDKLTPNADTSYAQFLKYMNFVFAYASTLSLENEMKPVKNISEIEAGDVFIKGGTPGHAMIVMAVAINPTTKKKIFLLAQSYMPAQDIHILINPVDHLLSPWYSEEIIGELVTPEWDFMLSELHRF